MAVNRWSGHAHRTAYVVQDVFFVVDQRIVSTWDCGRGCIRYYAAIHAQNAQRLQAPCLRQQHHVQLRDGRRSTAGPGNARTQSGDSLCSGPTIAGPPGTTPVPLGSERTMCAQSPAGAMLLMPNSLAHAFTGTSMLMTKAMAAATRTVPNKVRNDSAGPSSVSTVQNRFNHVGEDNERQKRYIAAGGAGIGLEEHGRRDQQDDDGCQDHGKCARHHQQMKEFEEAAPAHQPINMMQTKGAQRPRKGLSSRDNTRPRQGGAQRCRRSRCL